jgi:peptidoglycan/LPS O-acetylase OafA/YrhL
MVEGGALKREADSRGPTHSAEISFTYMPELDGLRAVSIALVVLSLFGLGRVVPGGFGVTMFFVISGFLITRQLLAETREGGRLDVGRFFVPRMLRPMPAAAAYILLSSAFFISVGGELSTVFHWLAMMIASHLLQVGSPALPILPTAGGLAWVMIASLGTALLACASFYLVESRIVRLRRRLGSRGATDIPLVAPKVLPGPRSSPMEGA